MDFSISSSYVSSSCNNSSFLSPSKSLNTSSLYMSDDADPINQSNEVFLGLSWNGSKLGTSYYDVNSSNLYMMLDIAEKDNFSILKQIICQIQPTTVVCSSKTDDRLLSVLKAENNEEAQFYPSNEFLPSTDFSYELCKLRLMSLELPSIPKDLSDSERSLYMKSVIPFENINMIQAAGGLLKYLNHSRVGIELEDDATQCPVMTIKFFTPANYMAIDNNTLSALQIFKQDHHPRYRLKTSNNNFKEGLSLFGLMNRCKSHIGRNLLKTWFLCPLRNKASIEKRLDCLQYFTAATNIEVSSSLRGCLRNIQNINRIMIKMRKAEATIADWKKLYMTVFNAIYIGGIAKAQRKELQIFRDIAEVFSDDLLKIANLIDKIVDFEESTAQNHFVVKLGIDPSLDEKKKTYNGLPDFMTQVAHRELKRLGDSVQECNVIYLPLLCYLLTVPKTDNITEENNYHLPGCEFVFFSNDKLHYKTDNTRELDRVLGDTKSEITDIENGIMHRLQDTILQHTDIFIHVMDYAAELDCLLTLAECANENGYIKPNIVTDDVLIIENGRHPLQELTCNTFVPNSTQSTTADGKMTIITGPNSSGKSVHLKQVALIVFMAHIGSFVPATQATIGLVDRIFSRIHTLDSVSSGLSTFMIDLNQVSVAARLATKNSLVVLDEFGKGTETIDGISLLSATLKYWMAAIDDCPHVLVSTHFHSIIQQSIMPQSPLLKYQTMEVLHDGDELVFLFHLIDGHTSSSYAKNIALKVGLSDTLVKRGTEVSQIVQSYGTINRVIAHNDKAQHERHCDLVNKFLECQESDYVQFLKDLNSEDL